MIDLMHMYNTFYSSLPEKVEEYCVNLNYLFPNIYDTKYLAQNNNIIQNCV